MSFAERCGLHSRERQAACEQLLAQVEASGIELIRLGWCDLHGVVRGKTIVASQLRQALANGIGMVSTLLLNNRLRYAQFVDTIVQGLDVLFQCKILNALLFNGV